MNDYLRLISGLSRLSLISARKTANTPRLLFKNLLIKKKVTGLSWSVFGEIAAGILSDFGPVGTKLGQILSTRVDLFPEDFCVKLEVLYSEQTPMKSAELSRILRKAYGRKLPFKKFDKVPLGVGSIGQVHGATLKDGDEIVVKVLRNRIAEDIQRDMDFLESALRIFIPHLKEKRDVAFVLAKTLEDLGAAFKSEVDLEREAKNLEKFRKKYSKSRNFYVPRIYKKLSSEFALVMERVEGIPLSNLKLQPEKYESSRVELAERILREIMSQVFADGEFHADPHAGNLFLMPDNRIAFLDLGLTGRLGDDDRRRITRAVRAFLDRDPDRLVKTLLEFGDTAERFDFDKFRNDLFSLVNEQKMKVTSYLSGKSSQDDAAGLEGFVQDLFGLARLHGIHVAHETTLLIKTMVTIEGVARSLHPEINLAKTAGPVVLSSLVPKWLRISFWAGRK